MFPRNAAAHNLRVKEFQLPRFNTVNNCYGKHPLRYQGLLLWSKLSSSGRTVSSAVTFKGAIIRKLDLEALMDHDDCKNCSVCRT